jgi:hypothetical protein
VSALGARAGMPPRIESTNDSATKELSPPRVGGRGAGTKVTAETRKGFVGRAGQKSWNTAVLDHCVPNLSKRLEEISEATKIHLVSEMGIQKELALNLR